MDGSDCGRLGRSSGRIGSRRPSRCTRFSEDVDGEHRPLHAKSLWLWNDRWHVYMIGSSNFTGAGLALPGRSPNAEANLVYVFREDGGLVRAMEDSLPATGDRIEDLDAAVWEAATEDDEDGAGGRPVLPAGFEEALFTPDADGGTLSFRLGSRGMPAEWEVRAPGGSGDAADVVLAAREWREAGAPGRSTGRGADRARPRPWMSTGADRPARP